MLLYNQFIDYALVNLSQDQETLWLIVFRHYVSYIFIWLTSQFKILHYTVVQIIWGALENIMNNEEALQYSILQGHPKYTWFNYNYFKEKTIPLYSYLKQEYYLNNIYNLTDTKYFYWRDLNSMLEWIRLQILYILNLIYIKFIYIFDFYSITIISYKLMKFIIILIFLTLLKVKNIKYFFCKYNNYSTNIYRNILQIKYFKIKNIFNYFDKKK
jgi:hypothetical protein